ncbi:2-C-methyl-D-erythritol 4-phosphate cytidylyltransferase/2-C-methyl-D-erythritol 2,4-cyclodiphosphate synthase [Galbitalea soli]|nr:2-C-methyl-D-erythritol 4-phosphate cytidylyltransferase/2-C-methyl-D-erythritol 2,4-cyclodiphosphate synthase [Galbitalea soli]
MIVVAAGSGSRLGASEPKAFVALHGRSILERSLDAVFGMAELAQVIVVVPESHRSRAEAIVAPADPRLVTVTVGGTTRQGSVAAGLAQLRPGIEVVLVHDAARPLTAPALFDTVVRLVRSSGDGVVPGLAVVDTLKQVDADFVTATVDRSRLSAVATPQGFPAAALLAAYAEARDDHTDDAALFAAAGHRVRVVEGDPRGFKITTPWDLRRAEQLLGETDAHAAAATRTGIGIDVHAFDEGAPLWLGGVFWPDEAGLAGHSDGDAVAHAICDALLSAAGLGDIGSRFGTDDPRFAGAHGEVFLSETVALVHGAGFRILNVVVQVVARAPRFAPRRAEVEARLSELVGAPVSVSATTSDGLGFTGRGEGVAAIATALLGG